MANRLTKELIIKGMIYQNDDRYEEGQCIHSIHEWGYIMAYYCNVLPTRLDLYDKHHQLICSLDTDDDTWTIDNGILKCSRENFFMNKEYSYDLRKGAPVHVSDVKDILFWSNPDSVFDTDRVIVLKDGRAFRNKDGEPLEIVDDASKYYLDPSFEVLGEDTYKSNIDVLNDTIVVSNLMPAV